MKEVVLIIFKAISPVTIYIDDAHSMDASSWQLIKEFHSDDPSVQDPRALFVMAARPFSTDGGDIASEMLKWAEGTPNCESLHLRGIGYSAVRELVAAELGVQVSQIDNSLLDTLMSNSLGNPLHTKLLLRWGIENGAIIEDADFIWKNASSRSSKASFPDDVQGTIRQRVDSLDTADREILLAACCMGGMVKLSLLCAATGLPESDVKQSLASLQERGFIADSSTLQHRTLYKKEDLKVHVYHWEHALLRQYVEELLTEDQRRGFHLQMALAMEGEIDGEEVMGSNDANLILGQHWEAAGQRSKAAAYVKMAAICAHGTHQLQQSIHLFTRAAELLDGPESAGMRASVLRLLGDSLRQMARYDDAERHINECLAFHTSLGSINEEYLKALTSMGVLFKERGQYTEAAVYLEQLIKLGPTVYEPGDAKLSDDMVFVAELWRKQGNVYRALPLHQEALGARSRMNEPNKLHIAESQTYIGCCLSALGQVREAQHYHRDALTIRMELSAEPLVAESLNYLGECLCSIDKPAAALPCLLHSLHIREKVLGIDHPAVAHVLANLTSAYSLVGRFAEADIHVKRCIAICEYRFRTNHPNLIPNLIVAGNHYLRKNDLDAAEEAFTRAVDIHRSNKLENSEARILALLQRVQVSRQMPVDFQPISHYTSSRDRVLIITDPARDLDDETAFVLLAALYRRKLVEPLGIVATLAPSKTRALLTRGTMDMLALPCVPVGQGSDGHFVLKDESLFESAKPYFPSCDSSIKNGQQLIFDLMSKAAPKSITWTIIASMQDAAMFLRSHEELVCRKVKRVCIMGGVEAFDPDDANVRLVPDTAYNNSCDMEAASYFYRRLQELGVPMLIVTRWTAYACPVPRSVYIKMAQSTHLVGTRLFREQSRTINQLWRRVNSDIGSADREDMPERCTKDWFCRTFTDGRGYDRKKEDDIWDLVNVFMMYDPLTLLLSIPEFRDRHATPTTVVVNGVEHMVIGRTKEDHGLVDVDRLRQDLMHFLEGECELLASGTPVSAQTS